MRLGIYGGSFDPVHYGHLLLAESCREQAALDEVWFMPAAQSPHKRDHAPTTGEHRATMLELAIGGHAALRVSRLELARGGVSFTVDTLAAVRAERPHDELFWLLGGDALGDFPTWREPRRICELATLLVVGRPGAAEPDFTTLASVCGAATVERIRSQQVSMPQIDLSSHEMRDRIASGRSIRYRTPRAVEQYIATQRLYISPTPIDRGEGQTSETT